MKILLLGGFLGSGKTSVLLPLARYLTAQAGGDGTRVAIIENEIGDVSIDGLTLKNAGLSVRELFSGCICCTLGVDLISGLMELEETQHPEWTIIEATGIAHPEAIAKNIRRYFPACTLLRRAVLVDAERYALLFGAIANIAQQQVAEADVLLLNKTDLVTPERCGEICADLRRRAPEAKLLTLCAKDGVDEEILRFLTEEEPHV